MSTCLRASGQCREIDPRPTRFELRIGDAAIVPEATTRLMTTIWCGKVAAGKANARGQPLLEHLSIVDELAGRLVDVRRYQDVC